jgi:hypothetical protein
VVTAASASSQDIDWLFNVFLAEFIKPMEICHMTWRRNAEKQQQATEKHGTKSQTNLMKF